MLDPTPEERAAIKALKRVARRWPKSLWLFSGSGTLAVLRYGEDGKPAMNEYGCVDQAHRIKDGEIDIPNDGGDW